ncbi:MAG: serine protease Do, partial [Maribacter sp.]
TSLNRTAAKPNKELIDLGVELRNLTIDESSKMRTKGVKVISIARNSKIDGTNMEPGYVITKLNDREVASIDELAVVYKDLETGTKIMFEGFYEEYPDEYFYAFRK